MFGNCCYFYSKVIIVDFLKIIFFFDIMFREVFNLIRYISIKLDSMKEREVLFKFIDFK